MPAGLYRIIDERRPDTALRRARHGDHVKGDARDPESGFKSGASVTLSLGRKSKRLQIYCPKAYASIGRAPSPMLIDLSIQIHMRRKMPHEHVSPFSISELAKLTDELGDRLANFRADFIAPEHKPDMPRSSGRRPVLD